MKNEISKIDDFNVNTLSEIKGKKEIIKTVIKNNPFVEIQDNGTFEIAKKSRTTLRTCRTDFEKEEKLLLNAVKNNISDPIKSIYKDFKDQVTTVENKQQEEVKRYEDLKEAERKEKERQEEERKTLHKNNIDLFFTSNKRAIEELDFQTCKDFDLNYTFQDQVFEIKSFEEFEDVFETKIELLKIQIAEKRNTLQEKEEIRIAQEKIENDRKEMNRINSIKKSISDYFTHWQNIISNDLNFKNQAQIFQQLINSKLLVTDEFEEDFEVQKDGLLKLLNSKKQLLQEAEENRISKMENDKLIEVQKQEVYQIRVKRLANIGFVLNDEKTAFDSEITNSTSPFENILNADQLEFEEILFLEESLADKIKQLNDASNIRNYPVSIEECIEDIDVLYEEVVVNQKEETFADNTDLPDFKDIFLGAPETVGQLRLYLSEYDDSTLLNFRNQPRQNLYETAVDGETIIYFQS